jgi:hypothetical protein
MKDLPGLEIKDAVTMSVALVGAVLGVMNTWNAMDQRRVRLRVYPKVAVPVMDGEFGRTMGCIEVINLSAFPVSIQEVGFTIRRNSRKGDRLTIVQPFTNDHKPLARRLESRQSVTAYFELDARFQRAKSSYVLTDCDEMTYGPPLIIRGMH